MSQMKKETVDIGSRFELFVDEWLIAKKRNVILKLHPPEQKEVVLTFEQLWEGPFSAYFSVIQDNHKIRMYYRGNCISDKSEEQVTCYAESEDGIHFGKPELGLVEFSNSTKNNIILKGNISHNFAPFYDMSPIAAPAEVYKAVGGVGDYKLLGQNKSKLFALCSGDGIHWSMKQTEPIMTNGAFDSQNVAFWDSNRKAYCCYSRHFYNHIRGVQSSLSEDFTHWGPQQSNEYATHILPEQFYTNATILCPEAEHMYLSFPMRFVPDRKKVVEHTHAGVSDTVFMTSRDGTNWDRTFMEAWIRPGLDQRNWTDRNNAVAYGCVKTGENEMSFYVTEHYKWESVRLRRYVVRMHRFASVHTGFDGGEFTTRPIIVSGERLRLNYSTSAVGFVQVEVLDDNGHVLDGMSFDDMEPLYGDELGGIVQWNAGVNLSVLNGKPIRFRFRMKDADLYSLRVL